MAVDTAPVPHAGEVVPADSGPQADLPADGTLSGELDTTDSRAPVQWRTPHGILTITSDQATWSDTQAAALLAIGINLAPLTQDKKVIPPFPTPYVLQFLHICAAAQLDPFRREAYLIRRGHGDKAKYTIQTGIDGFRTLGEATGQYRGQTAPQWCGKDGQWRDHWPAGDTPPVAARVGIFRAGFATPVWGVAHYAEYVPLVDEWVDRGGGRSRTGRKVPTDMWVKMPAGQLAKCAEALAWRKAFPRQMGGLYVTEEMAAANAAADAEADAAAAARRAEYLASSRAAGTSRPAESVAAEPTAASEPTTPPLATEPGQAPATPVPSPADGEPDEVTRLAWLHAEVAMQADVLGKTPAAHMTRATRAMRKNWDTATVEKLLPWVAEMRTAVQERLAQTGPEGEAQAAAYGRWPADTVAHPDYLLGLADPAEPGGFVPPSGE